MPDIKGTLFWLAVVLLALIWMMHGCGKRFDKFREHRQQRHEQWDRQRQQRHDQRQKQRDDRQQEWNERGNWRERRRQRSDDRPQDIASNSQSVFSVEAASELYGDWAEFTEQEIAEINAAGAGVATGDTGY